MYEIAYVEDGSLEILGETDTQVRGVRLMERLARNYVQTGNYLLIRVLDDDYEVLRSVVRS